MATRTLTGFTGTPRTDLMGEDASFEAGTGARKAKLDNILGEEAPTEEDWDYLVTDTYPHYHEITYEPGVYGRLEGYIDLTALASGESVTMSYSMSLVTPVSYVEYASEDYAGPVSPPLLHVTTRPARYGVRVRCTMSAAPAADRIFRVQFFKRRVT